MTRFHLGAGSLRILKDDADDPATTPSTDVDKFIFDSKVNDLGYTVAPYVCEYSLGTGFHPSGTNESTCDWWRSSYFSDLMVGFYPTRVFPFDGGFERFFDCHSVNPSTGRYALISSYGYFQVNGLYSYGLFGYGTIGELRPSGSVIPTGSNNDSSITLTDNAVIARRLDQGGANIRDTKYLIWNIPAGDEDFTPPSATPTSGQQNVGIGPTIVKVSRPGFDTATATGRELIADSDHIPAKLVKSGSIDHITAHSHLDIPLGVAVPDNTYFDGQFSDAGQSVFVIPGFSTRTGSYDERIVQIEYEFTDSNETLRITNRSDFPVFGRFMLFGGGDGQSSGSGRVFRTEDGYTQLCRPGANSPPNWDDVIADSRFQYIPLVDTAYVPKSAFSSIGNTLTGTHSYTVTMDVPSGYVPFVKLMYSFSGGRKAPPRWEILWNGNDSSQYGRGAGMQCAILSSNTTMLIRGNERGFTDIDGNGDLNSSNTGWVGTRYYVFAVPDTHYTDL